MRHTHVPPSTSAHLNVLELRGRRHFAALELWQGGFTRDRDAGRGTGDGALVHDDAWTACLTATSLYSFQLFLGRIRDCASVILCFSFTAVSGFCPLELLHAWGSDSSPGMAYSFHIRWETSRKR